MGPFEVLDMKSWPESKFSVVPACFPENLLGVFRTCSLCRACLLWAVKTDDMDHPRGAACYNWEISVYTKPVHGI